MYSYSLFIMDNFLLIALNDTWIGVSYFPSWAP